MGARELPEGWFCAGQEDLTELVDVEHISGSRSADEAAFEAERDAFYAALRARGRRRSITGAHE